MTGVSHRSIAMWSGPRNLSTAMMRAFAQRADCAVWDEPFYAAYLARTGLDHPMASEIIRAGDPDPQRVGDACARPPKPPKTVFYQKHMTHHMLHGFPLDWAAGMTNVFLIRAPHHVLASYVKKRQAVTAEDIGFRRQHELFEAMYAQTGARPIVIDSTDIRRDPATMLARLCAALNLAYDPAMTSWQPGPSPDDGVWGQHWYDAIWQSTGFAPPEPEPEPLPDHLQAIRNAVQGHYERLAEHKLMPPTAPATVDLNA